MLRCSPELVDRLVSAGRLHPVRLVPDDDCLRFTPEDLLDLVEGAAHGAGA